MSVLLFYFLHLSFLIGLPLLLFVFVVRKCWFVRSTRGRAVGSIVAAGILVPTAFVGHGAIIMPSSIGVVYALRNESEPLWPSTIIWLVGSALFFVIDAWLQKRNEV